MTTRLGGPPMRTRNGNDIQRPAWPSPESLVLFLVIVLALVAASVGGLIIGAAS